MNLRVHKESKVKIIKPFLTQSPDFLCLFLLGLQKSMEKQEMLFLILERVD